MKLSHIILLITLSVLSGCNHANINDASKRNENWVWWVDKTKGVGKWIPVADKTTVKDGDYTTFYSNGKINLQGRLRNGQEVDTIYLHDYSGLVIQCLINVNNTSYRYYPVNGS